MGTLTLYSCVSELDRLATKKALKSSGEEDGASSPGAVPNHLGGRVLLSSTPLPSSCLCFCVWPVWHSQPLVYPFTEMSLEPSVVSPHLPPAVCISREDVSDGSEPLLLGGFACDLTLHCRGWGGGIGRRVC